MNDLFGAGTGPEGAKAIARETGAKEVAAKEVAANATGAREARAKDTAKPGKLAILTGADDYSAKDIEVLEGLEPVRRRPGMYIGGTDETALHHLAAEILDNAMDEAVAGHASFIEVTLEESGYLVVRDNGRGIPVDPHPKFKNLSALEGILPTLHSGGKFGGQA